MNAHQTLIKHYRQACLACRFTFLNSINSAEEFSYVFNNLNKFGHIVKFNDIHLDDLHSNKTMQKISSSQLNQIKKFTSGSKQHENSVWLKNYQKLYNIKELDQNLNNDVLNISKVYNSIFNSTLQKNFTELFVIFSIDPYLADINEGHFNKFNADKLTLMKNLSDLRGMPKLIEYSKLFIPTPKNQNINKDNQNPLKTNVFKNKKSSIKTDYQDYLINGIKPRLSDNSSNVNLTIATRESPFFFVQNDDKNNNSGKKSRNLTFDYSKSYSIKTKFINENDEDFSQLFRNEFLYDTDDLDHSIFNNNNKNKNNNNNNINNINKKNNNIEKKLNSILLSFYK
ncbi:uncharacterized protein ASCRUDRAFT_138450 [Ascoidea rubescens DSM 1968]|uniref:Uncharacterized protein n=1 Tax=Ascoidea rubescens DSM 1968 TaxID=1344418 RepID=A0A1D2VJN5_9ASCO|nr:hypothetical protein ASCRUDRAFT_138450 [Ascoidea rubescens DSM 1968]ODV61822.1 hypothetical protein ASCRUDRAFT_138450 [Ascoidea rubescens DSM 1968]